MEDCKKQYYVSLSKNMSDLKLIWKPFISVYFIFIHVPRSKESQQKWKSHTNEMNT